MHITFLPADDKEVFGLPALDNLRVACVQWLQDPSDASDILVDAAVTALHPDSAIESITELEIHDGVTIILESGVAIDVYL